MLTSPTTNEFSIYDCPQIIPLVDDKPTKWKLNHIEIAPNCPRCASSNTKFCYYNNYSLSQPRYFCKRCRRYWTKGGSLRNVPVGGGCRKSRRSRSARQDNGTNNATSSAMSPGSAGSNGKTESGTDIDLAAVFAKYVNQNVENDESYSPGATTSYASLDNFQASSLEIESQMEDISTMFEYQKPLDNLVNGFDDQLQEIIPQISMHQNVSGHDQDFVHQNSDTFELQSIIGDESLAADMLWSNDPNLPNFGSRESMVQFQDFGLFSTDDQFRISANLVSDDWGSFDLSAYELFSRL